MDDILEPILRRTLFLWLLPYAIGYLVVVYTQQLWDWVTEPVEDEEKGGGMA